MTVDRLLDLAATINPGFYLIIAALLAAVAKDAFTRAVALVRGNERSDTQRQREAPRGQRAPAANELQCGEPARTHAAARRARRSFHQP